MRIVWCKSVDTAEKSDLMLVNLPKFESDASKGSEDTFYNPQSRKNCTHVCKVGSKLLF